MLSLHEGFPMFPTAHHPHHPHHTGVVGGVMGPGGGPVGHSTTPPHHAHHHHHHAAAAIHSLTARHHSQGPPPPPPSSSVAGQLNLHHAGHHQGPHHPHSHLNSAHHQMAAANQAYFAGYAHPHHWGNGGGAQGGHQTAPNAAMEHQQQFQVGGLVTSDGGNSWHPSPAAVYTGLSSSLSPRTPVTSVGYEEWVNSPPNNNGQQQQQSGGVSSPDGSPDGSPNNFGQQQQGNAANNGPSSPSLSDQQQLSSYSAAAAAAAAYGKMFSSSGPGDFISPHHAHLHHQHHHNNHGQMVVDPIRMNAGGVITGHHSPDSGLAGSDGLSSAGSPAQQQQQGMLGGGSSGNNLLNLQQQQQQQQNASGSQGAMTGPSSAGSMSQQNQQQLVGSNGAGMVNVSRPQPSRSPYEWMKKPSFHSTNVNPAGKTRTKDKYRVVYTDHQRLELEKEFHYSRYITIRRKSELASVLGLSERQVKIWFQNRRAKERKQVKKREEMLHKEKLDVVPSLGSVQQQQQQQQQQHHLHSGQQQQQHMQHMGVQQHPSLVSNPQISSSMHMGSVVQMDTKPVLGLD